MENRWRRRWVLLAQALVLLCCSLPVSPCPHRCTCHPLAVLGMSGADCAAKSLVAVPRARGGEKHLQVVELSGNRLRTLPDDAFGAFPSLKYLFLSDNMIQVVNQYAFRGVPDLEVVYLSENSLTSLPPNLFEDCVALRKVVLRGNPLLRLLPPAPPPGALAPVPPDPPSLPPFISSKMLQELDVSACGVDFIPNEAFSALPNLKKLNLSSNSLTEIDPRPFGPLCSLTHLDVTGNPIQCGCSTARLSRWIRERRVETARALTCSRSRADDAYVVDENEEEKMSQSVSPRCDMLLLKEDKFFAACQAALAEAKELQRRAVETKKTWIGVGSAVAGLAVAVLLVLCFIRRRRQKKRQKEERAARAAAKEKNGLDHQPLRDDADG
ncbi:leucine-rich repeat-containing protein 26-like isoform X2 [Hetaerina americana]